jgi:hypothetical protein
VVAEAAAAGGVVEGSAEVAVAGGVEEVSGEVEAAGGEEARAGEAARPPFRSSAVRAPAQRQRGRTTTTCTAPRQLDRVAAAST